MVKIFIKAIVIIGIIWASAISFCYADDLKSPWNNFSGNNFPDEKSSPQKHSANPLLGMVKFFRNYISPVDGERCPMHPSCSDYSVQAFEKYGFFKGWLMTCDRLLHEASEMQIAPIVEINGRQRFYDPLENNDFWWYKAPEK